MTEENYLQRVNYFNGELLDKSDYQTEQQYNTDVLRTLNASMFTYGVASGLDVIQGDANQSLAVTPGMAIDIKGREIVCLTPQVIPLAGRGENLYYLTVRYHEFLSDFTHRAGHARGFKRITESPKFSLQTSYVDPGLDILLAVVNVSPQGTVNSIVYNDGQSQRRQCGVRIGRAHFVLGGSTAETGPAIAGTENLNTGESGLSVEASRTTFTGTAVVDGGLGVGTETLKGDLTVKGIRVAGSGTISSDDTKVTPDGPVFDPPLAKGDYLIAEPEVGGPVQVRRVNEATSTQAWVDLAFDPPLENSPYWVERDAVASFHTHDNLPVLKVGASGEIGLGMNALAGNNNLNPDTYILDVLPSGKVGIGLSREPLEVLEVGGWVRAEGFIGSGKQLTDIPALWSPSAENADNIYYRKGKVGIGLEDPKAALQVVATAVKQGSGSISSQADSTLVTGVDTLFLEEISKGDLLMIEGEEPQAVQVAAVLSNEELETMVPLRPPVQQAVYFFRAPVAQLGQVPGTRNPALWVGANGKLGINNPFPAYALDIKGDVRADRFIGLYVENKDFIQCKTLEASESVKVGFELTLQANGRLDGVDLVAANRVQGKTVEAEQTVTAGGGIDAPALRIGDPEAEVPVLMANKEGKVGINTPAPEYALDVTGDIRATGKIIGQIEIDQPDIECETLSASDQIKVSETILMEADGLLSCDRIEAVRYLRGRDLKAESGVAAGERMTTPLLQVGEPESETPTLWANASGKVGVNTQTPAYALDVDGDIRATGKIIGDLDHDRISADSVEAGKELAVGTGEPADAIMTVSAMVAMFGAPREIQPQSKPQLAKTDGLVMGYVFSGRGRSYGQAYCFTSSGMRGAATGGNVVFRGAGNKNSARYLDSSFALPVRKGEYYQVVKKLAEGNFEEPTIRFYWMALGEGSTPPPADRKALADLEALAEDTERA